MGRPKKNDDEETRRDPFADGSNDAAEFLSESIDQMEEFTTTINEAQEGIRDIMRELGGRGYDTKQVRRAMAAKKAYKKNPEKFEADELVFTTYCQAIGLGSDY